MKRTNLLWMLSLLFVFTFFSCQDEESEIINPPDDTTVGINSTIANLMTRVATNDGSQDNILDGASCIEIALPVTVVVNGLEITIDSLEDLEIIELIFEEFADDEDTLDILFPITIILSDFTEVTINSLDELLQFTANCDGDNEQDDDIECVDFQYPIEFSVFDTNNVLLETVVINSDEELYEFIDELEDDEIASLNFPVTLILADGSTLTVNSQEELEEAIEANQDACDEDDDNDEDDDDDEQVDVTEIEFELLLKECIWEIDRYKRDGDDLTDDFETFYFDFQEGFTVLVYPGDDTGQLWEGEWTVQTIEGNLRLLLNVEGLETFNDNWIVYEVEADDDDNEYDVDLRLGIDRLKLEQDCDNDDNDDDDESDIESILEDDEWIIAYYEDQGEEQTNLFNGWVLDFDDNNVVEAENGSDELEGVWEIYEEDTLMAFVWTNAPFNMLNEDAYEILDVQEDRVEIKYLTDTNVKRVVFEKL